jgi:4-diphosphocytidyl-2C-methyl-D-erythritol kinase
LLVAWPQGAQDANKTASMYGALRAEHYTDGTATEALAARIRKGKKVAEQDIYNVFGLAPTPEGTRSRRSAERLSAQTPPMTTLRLTTQPAPGMKRARSETRRTTTSSSSHLCGSGPAFFFLARSDEHAAALADGLRDMGLEVRQTTTIAAPEALSITKLS